MNCRGLPGKKRNEKALQTKKTKRRENPRLTSYFPEEYTVCHAGNPHNLKVRNSTTTNPKSEYGKNI